MLSLDGRPGNAVWWADGVIREVGPSSRLDLSVPRGVPVWDLPGAIITPGMVDGHTHFSLWALGRRRVQLAGCAEREEAVRRVGAALPVDGWVRGQGWNSNGWREAPDRSVLDRVHSGPVFLESLDVHAAWVNSAALRAAGIDRDTPDPYGGRIVRDAAGEPTGLLLERAVELMLPHLPPVPPGQLTTAVTEGIQEAHRLGITGVHDVEGHAAWVVWRALALAGELPLRVLFHPPVESLGQLVAEGWRSGVRAGPLTLGGVKLFLDGSLGSRTAWMLEPFEGTHDRGMPITDGGLARAAVEMASAAGISATVHAIGDAAVRRALDLLESVPKAGIPHRIEHFQCVQPVDLARAARAGILVSMQPAHLLTDAPLVDRHWGDRGAFAYHFRSILAAGNQVVFGSDAPVASLDPRDGIFAALDRRPAAGGGAGWRADERIGLEAAVRAYTRAAAAAAGAPDVGALAPGMAADLVAWEVDPAAERSDSGSAFRAGQAVLTVLAGRPVWDAT
ncbi:MAG TPA: amidohydrolase [Gemmatimonadales bacterium]|nr:amidohydrolase [Gemmatimonadales bacterium]